MRAPTSCRLLALVLAVTALGLRSRAQDDVVSLPPARHPGADRVTYFIVTDRFDDRDPTNNRGGAQGGREVTGFDPTSKQHFHGGDLAGVRRRLDYIGGLGATSVWLTPIFRNKTLQGSTAGYHGYWIVDFLAVDPHLGTEDEFGALVADGRQRGIGITLDVVVNHTADVIRGGSSYRSRLFWPYRTASGEIFDERALTYNGIGAPRAFPSLSAGISFPYPPSVTPDEAAAKRPAWLNDLSLYHNRGDASYSGEDFLLGDISGLDDLFTENAAVVQGMTDIYRRWVQTHDLDGFRIDTVKHVNAELWQAWAPEMARAAAAAGNRRFLQFGEVFSGDTLFLSEWSTAAGLDSTLDFAFAFAARDYVSRGRDASTLAAVFDRDDAYTDFDSSVHDGPTFLGNHDIGRFGSFLRQDNPGADDATLLELAKVGHALMFLSRGHPVVYYGDEQGMAGAGGDADARQDLFASATPQYQAETLIGSSRTGREDKFDPTHPLYRTLGALAALRRAHPGLSRGAQWARVGGAGPVLGFSRIGEADLHEYLVMIHAGRSGDRSVVVPTSQAGGRGFTLIFDSRLPANPPASPLIADASGAVNPTLAPLQVRVWRADEPLRPRSEPLDVRFETPAIGGSVVSFTGPRTFDGSVFAGRAELRATVTGAPDYARVTFAFQRPGRPGQWEVIGTDDAPPYRVPFRPPPDLDVGGTIALLVTASDARGRSASRRLDGIRLSTAGNRFGIEGGESPSFPDAAPAERTAPPGAAFAFAAEARGTGPMVYQWYRDGRPATTDADGRLILPAVSAADAGEYAVVARNRAGATTITALRLRVAEAGARLGRPVNLSVRAATAGGQDRLIAGFVASGPGKPVLVRAIGPTLGSFGVPGFLPDPRLELFEGATRVRANDDWSGTDGRSLGAFPLPAGSADAVLEAALAGSAYTAHVSGGGELGGVALLEVYDAAAAAAPRLVNLSARCRVGPDAEALIAGFVVRDGRARFLVRAVGPGLVPFGVSGVLENPKAEIRSQAGELVAAGDDWEEGGGGATAAAAAALSGAFPLASGSRDAALVVELPPGGYTVRVDGAGRAPRGVALVELYLLP